MIKNYTTTDEKEVEAALISHFGEQPAGEVRFSLTKKAFRGTLKVFAELNEETALKLVRAGYLKVGWVYCRVHKKMQVTRCYRCLGFGHMAAVFKGPDRTRGCSRCSKEGHRSVECVSTLKCYLCASKAGKPWTDHLLGTMRCASFREAALL